MKNANSPSSMNHFTRRVNGFLLRSCLVAVWWVAFMKRTPDAQSWVCPPFLPDQWNTPSLETLHRIQFKKASFFFYQTCALYNSCLHTNRPFTADIEYRLTLNVDCVMSRASIFLKLYREWSPVTSRVRGLWSKYLMACDALESVGQQGVSVHKAAKWIT